MNLIESNLNILIGYLTKKPPNERPQEFFIGDGAHYQEESAPVKAKHIITFYYSLIPFVRDALWALLPLG